MDIPIQAQILALRTAVESTLAAERDVVSQQPTPDARWSPGDRLSARVEAALPGGRFHVRVDDLLLEMQLPGGFEVGDRAELEFVAGEPRPSFLLRTGQDAPPDTEVALSRSGRQLDEIIKSVASERSLSPSPVRAAEPLLPEPTIEAPKIAQALAQALSRSGLFYESHQAEWVLGQRLIDELLQEPQGRLSQLLDRLVSGDAASASATRPSEAMATRVPAAASRPAQAPDQIPARIEGRVPPTGGAASSPVTGPGSSIPPQGTNAPQAPNAGEVVHPAAAPQVRSQLDALDTHQMVWQGQLWVGQHLQWSIRDPGEQTSSAQGELQPWFTELRLRLPRLGEVVADLALIGPGLRVRLAAPQAATQGAMNQGRASLADSLARAGIDLVSFKVSSSAGD